MTQRTLSFATYVEVIAEIERLERGGYGATGRWNLGQVCEHLAYYFRGSLDGFGFRLPWIVRFVLGRPALRKLMRTRKMRAGLPTVPASVPAAQPDDPAAIQRVVDLLRRLAKHTGPLQPSPLFGSLSADQWRVLHLVHAAHHLGFLIPGATAEAGLP